MVNINNRVTTPKTKKETITISDWRTELVVEWIKRIVHKNLKEKGVPDLRKYKLECRIITWISEKMIETLPEGVVCNWKNVYILRKQSDELDKAYQDWCVINGLTMWRIDN